MSISKLTLAALNNTLELQPALANLNFDFSLWKVQAPKEFDGVGSALSYTRRDVAENGSPHATAQKLGALFEKLVPPAPNLLRAYGQRASEISQAVSLTPAARKSYGAFSGHAGSDATSIWAAATSGRPTAMAAHLLACFLARIWDGPQAVSIWVELVERRKEIIKAEFNRTSLIELSALEVARQEITRAQIGEWDASARAWMRTADTVKSRQHKQLKLIIDNLDTAVNQISDTYDSVITAWKNCLSQMEGLIEGIAQQAFHGDIMIAMSAWHLYPDMSLVVPTAAHVFQSDPIFASGGVLTIGLETRDSQHNGVSWSLPLACLRYYGEPVMASCSVNSNEGSRLTLEELLLSIVGCFLAGWEVAESDTSRALKWLAKLADILHEAVDSNSREARALIGGVAASSWFSLLLSTAQKYQRSSDDERHASRRLVSLGRKHGKNFLGLPKYSLFGLTRRGQFVGIMKNEDERIQFLREVAQEIQTAAGLENHHLVIRYKHQCLHSTKSFYEYASALPLPRKSTKRNAHGDRYQSQGHCRWLYASERSPQYDIHDERYRQRLEVVGGRAAREYVTNFPSDSRETRSVEEYCDMADPRIVEYVQQDFEDRARVIIAAGEHIYKRDYEYIQDLFVETVGIFWPLIGRAIPDSLIHDERSEPFYKTVFGDTDSAALFVLEGRTSLVDLAHPAEDDTARVFTIFEESRFDHDVVVRQLSEYFQMGNPKADPYFQCAKGISTAATLYKNLAKATVDVRVLQRSLHGSRWLRKATCLQQNFDSMDIMINARRDNDMMAASGDTPASLLPYKLDRATSFACIAMFDSGLYDSDPDELDNVMAMSSGDSIYASVALLNDPSENSHSQDIARIRGNIGRPGIAYLVPPRDPLIKKAAINEWPNISRENFDGQIKDSFHNTSLHLAFTGAQSRVNLEFSGAQDDDVYMLETLISVHDEGRWVADLDPLKTLSSLDLWIIPACDDKHAHRNTAHPHQRMTSIENWFEMIDPPESRYAIVQAHGNLEARLAAASISVALGFRTLILPRRICWTCFESTVADVCRDQRQRNIVIS